MLYSRGDRVYAYGIKEPGRYLVYRANKDIVDPDTHKFLGQEVVFSGIVSTLPYTNSALDARSEKMRLICQRANITPASILC